MLFAVVVVVVVVEPLASSYALVRLANDDADDDCAISCLSTTTASARTPCASLPSESAADTNASGAEPFPVCVALASGLCSS